MFTEKKVISEYFLFCIPPHMYISHRRHWALPVNIFRFWLMSKSVLYLGQHLVSLNVKNLPWSGINAKCCRLSRPELQTGRQKYLNMVLFYAWYIYGHSTNFRKHRKASIKKGCDSFVRCNFAYLKGTTFGWRCNMYDICMHAVWSTKCLPALFNLGANVGFFKYCAASSSMRLNSVTTEYCCQFIWKSE